MKPYFQWILYNLRSYWPSLAHPGVQLIINYKDTFWFKPRPELVFDFYSHLIWQSKRKTKFCLQNINENISKLWQCLDSASENIADTQGDMGKYEWKRQHYWCPQLLKQESEDTSNSDEKTNRACEGDDVEPHHSCQGISRYCQKLINQEREN